MLIEKMTNQNGRSKKINLGTDEWISKLSFCIASLGSSEFPKNLVSALLSIAQFDHSVFFAYHQKEKPICLYSNFSSEERAVFVDDYVQGPYLLDPFFKACERSVETGLYRLSDIAPDRFLQSEYYRSYYIRTGLSEEICYTIYLSEGVSVVISLMRSRISAKFSAREFKLFSSLVPVVNSLAQQHWKEIDGWFKTESTDQEVSDNRTIIENIVSTLLGSRITPRESQVVAHVLEGHSSEAIARYLDISVGTVRIHRRNIYAKLNISSQQELFSIFFKTIKTART